MSEFKEMVVVRYHSKKVVKGYTSDFDPWEKSFHVVPLDIGIKVAVKIDELKGVFFVKSFEGKRGYHENHEFLPHSLYPGKRVKLVLKDLEPMVGTIGAGDCTPFGFIFRPVDENSNNHAVFVPNGAWKDLIVLP